MVLKTTYPYLSTNKTLTTATANLLIRTHKVEQNQ